MSIRSESNLNPQRTFDVKLLLKDAGLVASSAAATVASVAKILDIGAGRCVGDIILDVTAIEIGSNDETFRVVAQFSNSPTFASGIRNGASQQFSAAGAADGGAAVADVGRYTMGFNNVINGVHYRYMRLYTVVAGTIATGINYSAFAAPQQSFPG